MKLCALILGLLLAFTARAQAPAAVMISPPPGTYTGSVTITLTVPTPGAVIYYTTDGSIPTIASPRYTGPFQLSSSKVVQAIAVVAQSPMISAVYTVVPPPTTFNYTLGANVAKAFFSWKVGTALPAAQTVAVWDSSPCPPPTGVPTCHWPVTVTSDQAWLVPSVPSGSTGFLFNIAMAPSSLSAGTYTGNVILVQPQFKNGTVKIPVTLTVVGAPPPPPPVYKVTLAWGNVSGALGYTLYRSLVSGGPSTSLGLMSGVGFVDGAVSAGKNYCYTVTETMNGLESAKSNELCVSIPTP